MINVTLFLSFTKDGNSTKRPPGATMKQEYSCSIHEPCNILMPKIGLNLANDVNVSAFTYAYIQSFGNRYYWIENWEYAGGFWWASLHCDVLASHKVAIGASSQYVLRSASAYNGKISDGLYPCTTDITISSSSVNPFVQPVLSNGRFVIGVLGGAASNTGCITYYCLTASQFYAFAGALLDDSLYYVDGMEISQDLQKTLFNPMQYITSCMWFPLQFSGTPVTSLKLGWWSIPCECSRLDTTGSYEYSGTFTVNKHPNSSRGSYLNHAPFAKYTLEFLPYGVCEVDGSIIGESSFLAYRINVDYMTGDSRIDFTALDAGGSEISRNVIVLYGRIGVPMAIGQVVVDKMAGVNSIVQGFASGLSGGIVGAIIGGISGIYNAAQAVSPTVSITGSNGSTCGYSPSAYLRCKFYKPVSENIALYGRPLCETRTISTLSGYIKTDKAHIEVAGATKTEIESIEGFMEGGFFYE